MENIKQVYNDFPLSLRIKNFRYFFLMMIVVFIVNYGYSDRPYFYPVEDSQIENSTLSTGAQNNQDEFKLKDFYSGNRDDIYADFNSFRKDNIIVDAPSAEISINSITTVETGDTCTITFRVYNTGNSSYQFGIGCDINDTERNTLIGRPPTIETPVIESGAMREMSFEYIIPKTCLSGEYQVTCAVWDGEPGVGQHLNYANRSFTVEYEKHSELFPWKVSGSDWPYALEDDLENETYNDEPRNSPDYRYYYCRRGVLQSNDTTSFDYDHVAELGFSALTVTDTINLCKEDLFLMRCDSNLSTPEDCFPDGGEFISWESPNLQSSINWLLNDKKCKINDCASGWNYHLFRCLHFENPKDTDGNTIGNNHKKLIILIHGWNPDSDKNPYKYEEGYDDTKEEKKYFQQLSSNLRSELSAINKGDWKIIEYNWARDADTGEIQEAFPDSINFTKKNTVKTLDSATTQHGTEAAETAHVHGQFLGEYLIGKCPDLEKVQFIAHSAGSWCARTAATYIAEHSTTVQYQVTLLDPFMPKEGDAESSLGKVIMGRLDNLTNKPIYLENYYTYNDKWHIGSLMTGTRQEFSWSFTPSIQKQLDKAIGLSHYDTHSAPVKYYTDTITGTVQDAENEDDINYNWRNTGWYMSLAYREPEITIIRPESNITLPETQDYYFFSGSASNESNSIDSVEYRLNSTNWQTASGDTNWTFTVSNLRLGTNTIEVRAKASCKIYSDIESRIIIRGETEKRYYVSPDGNDANHGLSWSQAFQTITHALEISKSGDHIWLQAGTYSEGAEINVPVDVSLFGGFSGIEVNLNERNIELNKAVIDGEESYRCMQNSGAIDGLYVTKGVDDVDDGGGIFNSEGGTVSNCSVYGNTTTADASRGGGIFNSEGGTVTNCKVYGNIATGRGVELGGGIYNSEGGTVANCTVYDNNAEYGGGIYNYKGIVTICMVSDNRAYLAGGIDNHGIVTKCTVYCNSSFNIGGIDNIGTVTNCTIYGNKGSIYAGGIYNSEDGMVINCTIYGNRVYGYAGGVYNYKGIVTNCTVYGNTATAAYGDECGIYNWYGTVTNCIAWNNSHQDIYCDASDPGTVYYSCYETGTNVSGHDNIQQDPLFLDAENGDFYLWIGSPCIDSGTATDAPEFDFIGISRPQGAGYDMGAYEYTGPKTSVSDLLWPEFK